MKTPAVLRRSWSSVELINGILAYEEGGLEHDEIVELFQQLIDSGVAWTLQGFYGRTAMALIESGECHR
jgi:hypothetical protein